MSKTQVKNSLSVSWNLLSGGGEMGTLIRAQDWSHTELGAVETWPQSLRTAVSIMLDSRFGMYIAWGKQYIQLYNDHYRPILGSTKHPAALGLPAKQTFSESWHIIEPLFDDALQGNATGGDDWMLPLDRHGYLEECYFNFSYSPIRDESGGVGGVIVIVTETTARVIGERRIKTLRELASRSGVVQSENDVWKRVKEVLLINPKDIPFGVLYRLDANGEIVSFIDGVCEAASLNFFSNTILKSGKLKEVLTSGKTQFIDNSVLEDKSVYGVVWPEKIKCFIALPVGGYNQTVAYGFIILGISPRLDFNEAYRDFFHLLTEQVASAIANAKAFDEERNRAQALIKIDRAKTAFFSNISHEFRTPLTLMIGPLQDLIHDSKNALTPEDRVKLELTYRNALRLLKLVNTLLDFSRIEAGRVKARFSAINLSLLTADLTSMFRSAFEKAGVKLIVKMNTLVQETYIDRDMWEKIVLNLLSNALKYTFAGEVQVTLSERNGSVFLCVRDSGRGIPENELSQIFERFYRVEGSCGRTYEGTGIGLSLVKELVKMHGGTITVESMLGKGSQFQVEIPLGKAHLPSDQVFTEILQEEHHDLSQTFVEEAVRWLPTSNQSNCTPSRSKSENPNDRGKILVADDNADMRAYVQSLLETEWEVQVANDGNIAYELATAFNPDLILSDIMMPNCDGFQLLAKLKSNPYMAKIPVIFLSARAGEEQKIEGLHAGADDYLFKPFSAKELIARIRTHLQIRRLKAEAQLERSRLSAVFEQAPVGIAMLEGPDHIFALSNPTYLSLLFGEHRDFIGKPVRTALPETEEQGFVRLLDNVFQTGQPYLGREIPIHLTQSDGNIKKLFLNFVYQPLTNSNGVIQGIMAVVVDVTEQVITRKKIEESIASRDEFLSIASHELKTPVTSLQLQLQLLKRKINANIDQTYSTEKFAQMVDASTKQVNRLTDLLEDLLDVSRIQAGKLQFNFEETNVERLVHDVIDRLSEQLEKAKSQIKVYVASEISSHWDRSRIEQMIVNLLSNSIKYAPGSPIEFHISQHEETAIIIVEDFGPGIPQDRQARIFERFERATSARNISGLGLGLFIVKEIITGHGGTIQLYSIENRGTKFIIKLPLRLQ